MTQGSLIVETEWIELHSISHLRKPSWQEVAHFRRSYCRAPLITEFYVGLSRRIDRTSDPISLDIYFRQRVERLVVQPHCTFCPAKPGGSKSGLLQFTCFWSIVVQAFAPCTRLHATLSLLERFHNLYILLSLVNRCSTKINSRTFGTLKVAYWCQHFSGAPWMRCTVLQPSTLEWLRIGCNSYPVENRMIRRRLARLLHRMRFMQNLCSLRYIGLQDGCIDHFCQSIGS